MKEWFSAAELVGCPGLPSTSRRIRGKAIRDCWQNRRREGRGGGSEYHISSLPAETQQHLYTCNLSLAADGSIEVAAIEPTPRPLPAVDPRSVDWDRGDRLEVDGRRGMVDGFIGSPVEGLIIWWDDDASHPFNVWFHSVSRVVRLSQAGTPGQQVFSPAGQKPPAVDATPGIATSAPTAAGQLADRADNPRSVSSSARSLASSGNQRAVSSSGSALRAIVRTTVPETEPTDLPRRERVAIARISYIQAQLKYCAERDMAAVDCEYEFCQALKDGLISVYDWVKRLQKPPSRSSLCRWKAEAKAEGLLAIAPDQRRKKGTIIDTNDFLRGFLTGCIIKWPHVKYSHLYKVAQLRFPSVELTEPTLRRWVQRWKAENHNQYALATNPDDWKNRYLPAFGSYSESVTALNDLWELDSTPADVMLADGRYAIVGCIDVYSRRAKLLVTKTSKAVAIVALLRRCILDWGVPRTIKTDNGKDYTAFHIQHVVQALNIEQKLCQPFSPEQKPHVERFLGTFLHDFLELLPGYLGHSVADRKAIESRKSFAERFGDKAIAVDLDLRTFQGFCDAWTEGDYAKAVHGSTGKSPLQMAAGQPVRRIEDERQLDLLMAETATRTVQKKGIKIEGRWFVAPELAAQIGNSVHLRLPQDAGIVYVFADSSCSEFICVAEDPEFTGASRQKIARQAAAWKKQQREAVRTLRKLVDTADLNELPIEIIEAGREAAGKVAALPGRAEQHALPAAAGEAVDQFLSVTGKQEPIPLTANEEQHYQQRQQAKAEAEARQQAIPAMRQEMMRDFAGWFDREIFAPMHLEGKSIERLKPEVQEYVVGYQADGTFDGYWEAAMSRHRYRTTQPKAM